ncbi:MAG: hypothetical protein EXS00_02105 [Phycisphaerales bacterium]|nr:hypothetical protein [Phycisphaerales bacterium]
MPEVVLFDDGRLDLGPLSDLRSSFQQRTGALTMIERILLMTGSAPGIISAGSTEVPRSEDLLLVNGALLCGAGILEMARGSSLRTFEGRLAAARCTGQEAEALLSGSDDGAPGSIPDNWRLLERPWDLLGALSERITLDIALRERLGGLQTRAADEGSHKVLVAPDAHIGAGVIFDTRLGPVLIEQGASVEAGAVICGPASIGKGSVVSPRAIIRPGTSVGPHCKVGGEISNTVFQGYSNKAHDGYLGDALVGEWVNLGAGTLNSNLLNTYGEVVMRLRSSGSIERTGRQFMGCLIGDHVKTAIGTRIMTGAAVGTGSMYAASTAIKGVIAPFSWCTDDGSRAYRVEKFLEVARAVVTRRGQVLSAADENRLRTLHAAAQ